MRTITLTTDFGVKDWYVGTMKGVILNKTRDLEIQLVDICHDIQQGAIHEAAFVLANACPFFPMNSIHVTVVDPGVGSQRHPIIVETEGPTFIGPDNGVFTIILKKFPPKNIYIIENPEWMASKISHTFHGRDIFATAAAEVAIGTTPISAGKVISEIVSLPTPYPSEKSDRIDFEIIHIDHFGNLITNIPSDSTLENKLQAGTSLFIEDLPEPTLLNNVSKNYADMKEGTPTLIRGSSGYWEISVKNQSCAKKIGIIIKASPQKAKLKFK